MSSPPTLGATLLDPGHAEPHVLPTVGLAFGLDGPLLVRSTHRRVEAGAFVLDPELAHSGTSDGLHAIALVDDRTPVGSALVALRTSVHANPPWLRDIHRELLSHAHEIERPGVLVGWVGELLHRAVRRGDWRAPRRDARVDAALGAIEESVRGGVALPRPLVRGISPAHLRALFKQEVGRTISDHVRRRRLLVAVAAIGHGASATQAAHAAGFSDSAHLSRTARAGFGTTLRTIRSGSMHLPD